MAFTARGPRVVIGMAEALQFVLIDQVMSNAAKRIDNPVVFALEDLFGNLDLRDLLVHGQIDLQVLVQPPRWRQYRTVFEALFVAALLNHLVHQVADPGPDRFDHDLRAFLLEEAEHIEIAIALGSLGPKLTGDLHDGFYARAVDLN